MGKGMILVGLGLVAIVAIYFLTRKAKAVEVGATAAEVKAAAEAATLPLPTKTDLSAQEQYDLAQYHTQSWAEKMEEPGAIVFPIQQLEITDEKVSYTGGQFPVSYPAGHVGYDATIHQLQSEQAGGIHRSELWWMQQEALADAGKPQLLYLQLISDAPPTTEAQADEIIAAGKAIYQMEQEIGAEPYSFYYEPPAYVAPPYVAPAPAPAYVAPAPYEEPIPWPKEEVPAPAYVAPAYVAPAYVAPAPAPAPAYVYTPPSEWMKVAGW